MSVITYQYREWRIPEWHYSENPDDAIFFYGGPFSNFVGGPFHITHPQPWLVTPYPGLYPTVEHFYQASKARDRACHVIISTADGPWGAKKLGRRTPLRPDWEDVKGEVMLAGLRKKFSQPEFREFLLATGQRLIAEDSPSDFIWGIRDKQGGMTGDNLLGKALMQIRDEISMTTNERRPVDDGFTRERQ